MMAHNLCYTTLLRPGAAQKLGYGLFPPGGAGDLGIVGRGDTGGGETGRPGVTPAIL